MAEYCAGYKFGHTVENDKLPGIRPIPPRPPTTPVPDLSKGVYPPGRYLDKRLGVYRCHAAVGTHELAPVNMTNQWQRAW